MKVYDVMTTDVAQIDPDRSVAEAAAAMRGTCADSLVVTEDDRIEGIITERDVFRVVAEGDDPHDMLTREVMHKNVVVSSTAMLNEAAGIMTTRGLSHLPVVDSSGHLTGLIGMRDVVALLARGRGEPELSAHFSATTLSRVHRLEPVEAGDLD